MEFVHKYVKYIREVVRWERNMRGDAEEEMEEDQATGAWATNMTKDEEQATKDWLNENQGTAEAAIIEDERVLKEPEAVFTLMNQHIQKSIFDALTHGYHGKKIGAPFYDLKNKSINDWT
eukprot:16443281-Heterocapsa_arctica.AAC.1